MRFLAESLVGLAKVLDLTTSAFMPQTAFDFHAIPVHTCVAFRMQQANCCSSPFPPLRRYKIIFES